MLDPSRVCVRFLAVTLAVLSMAATLADPASAEVLPFRATLTVLMGPETAPFVPQPTAPILARGSAHYSRGGFTLPAGAFAADRFTGIATTAGGPVPVPTAPVSIYVIGQQLEQLSGPGAFASGPEPHGGFGGTLNAGAALNLILGLPGVPIAPGSVRVPLPVGVTTTVQSTAVILGNVVLVTVFAEAWTTGTITFDDRSKGTTFTRPTPIPNPILTAGTARGSRDLDRFGGSISLVSPLVIRVPYTPANLLAGYARLDILFGERALVPEPALALMLGAAAALVGFGRARRRPRV